jgi:CheY-like chemotaxis protein
MRPDDEKSLVIIIEDDADAAYLLRRLLAKSGLKHDCVHLADGEQAVDFLSRNTATTANGGQAPQLILLDIKMPKVNGFEVLEWIRSHAPGSIPIIVMSTSDDPNDKQRAEALGADAFVSKFPSLEAFRVLLAKLLSGNPLRPLTEG